MQHSSRQFSRLLAVPLLAGLAVLGVAGSQPVPPDALDPELREDLSAADIRPASDVPPDAVDPELREISDATGRLERRPVAGDVWLDTEFEVYFHVRVLFRTSRRNTTTRWSAFELAD